MFCSIHVLIKMFPLWENIFLLAEKHIENQKSNTIIPLTVNYRCYFLFFNLPLLSLMAIRKHRNRNTKYEIIVIYERIQTTKNGKIMHSG
jgi:chloramphenicol O-acetyltransferase